MHLMLYLAVIYTLEKHFNRQNDITRGILYPSCSSLITWWANNCRWHWWSKRELKWKLWRDHLKLKWSLIWIGFPTPFNLYFSSIVLNWKHVTIYQHVLDILISIVFKYNYKTILHLADIFFGEDHFYRITLA